MISPQAAPDLTHLHGFGLSDLADNELGSLSNRQRSLLHRRLLRDLAGVAVLGAFVGWSFAMGGHLVGVIGGLMLAYCTYKLVDCAVNVRRGRVCWIEGDARRQLVPDSEGPDEHYLHMGSMRLDITKEIYSQIQDGGPYRVFYLDGTRLVVSAAPMAGWRPLPPTPAKRGRRWNIEIGF